jgi:hypothetical protein
VSVCALTILLFLLGVQPAQAAISFLSGHACAGSEDGQTVATTVNSTGADLIVVVTEVSQTAPTAGQLTENKSNSGAQVKKTDYGVGAGQPVVTIFFYWNPTSVGASHTFTLNMGPGAFFPAMCVASFSGSKTSASPFDAENGATGTGTSRQPGSVTPAEDGELLVTGLAWGSMGLTAAINGSFSIADQLDGNGTSRLGIALAYKIQASAGAENPTWSWSGSNTISADIATFKAAAGGGGGGPPAGSFLLIGVGR